MQDLRKLMDRAAACGMAHDLPGCLNALNEALPALEAAMDGLETIGRGSLSAHVGIALLKTHRWIP